MVKRAARAAALLYLCLGLALTLAPARRLPVRPVEALSTHALPANATHEPSVTQRHRNYRDTVATADVVVNVLMFMPLGALVALGWAGAGLRHVAVLALALSCSVELAQVMIAGRSSQARDVMLNTLGAVAGLGVARVVRGRTGRATRSVRT